jgi:carbon monoxide dehydrogenase subunit G
MKISGTATLHAPPPDVWTALNDPAVLTRAIPRREHLEATGPDSYRLTLTAGVGSIQGTYTSEISLIERQEPTSLYLAVKAAGAPGRLNATVLVVLAPSGNSSTEVTYAGDAIPDGMMAAIGQRLLASTVKKLARDFFASVDELLVTRTAAPAPSTAPPEGVHAGGAAGVSSPAAAPAQGASGMTTELPADDGQPSGRLRVRPPSGGFLPGALAGAAATLAGVFVARLLRRRSR